MRPGCPSGRHDADRIHLVCVRIFWSNKELRGAWRAARPHSSLEFFWYTIAPGSVLVFPKVPRSIRFSRCPPARPRRAARSYIARTGRPRGRESGAPHFLHVRGPRMPGRAPRAGAAGTRGGSAESAFPREIPCMGGGRGPVRAATRIAHDRSRVAVFPRGRRGAHIHARPHLRGAPARHRPSARRGRVVPATVKRSVPSDGRYAAYWSPLTHYLG